MANKLLIAAQYLLGLAFLVFGLDGFFHFIPIPPARPPAQQLIGALIHTGYFFQMVKAIEVTAGILLLSNRLVPLALVLLAPLLVGITSIHAFLNPEGLPLMIVLIALHLSVVKAHWAYLRPLLTIRTSIAPALEDEPERVRVAAAG
jgi:putative oxidoreductase